ncbi:MAG: GntR family transcriptional regulator [Gammaproteobacteria bacterium]
MNRSTLPDQITAQLEQMIADGSLKPGERLPAERKLSERLGVSRPSLREAIKNLTSKGLVVTRQGGGTYIKESLDDGITDPLLEILQSQPESRYDVLEVRHALDGQAAYFAAIRATESDRYSIQKAFERTLEVHQQNVDPMVEAIADAEFHLTITEASHNIVLLPMQHETLMQMVIQGDPDGARQAAQTHLVFVEESLQGIDQEKARHERFLRQASILKPAEQR